MGLLCTFKCAVVSSCLSTPRRAPWRRSWSCAWSPWSSTGASSCSGTARYYLSVKNRLKIYLWIFLKIKLTNWSTVKCCLKWQCHDIVRQFFSPGPLTNSQKIVFLSVYLLCFAICLSPLFSPCLSPLFLYLCISFVSLSVCLLCFSICLSHLLLYLFVSFVSLSVYLLCFSPCVSPVSLPV